MRKKCKICGKIYKVGLLDIVGEPTQVKYCTDCRENSEFDGTIEVLCKDYSICNGNVGSVSVGRFADIMDNIAMVNQTKRDKFGNSIRRKIVEVTLRDTADVIKGFPICYEDMYLILKEDLYSPTVEDGMHRMGSREIKLPLYQIAKVKVKREDDDVYVQDIEEPIIGYKAVTEHDGVLKANNYIYEIGVPYEEEQKNPYQADYQDCYSHFCRTIEDVLKCPGGTDYIHSQLKAKMKIGTSVIRLFRVKAEKHCLHNTQYGWVTNKLTLLEEVTHDEIVEYFNQSEELRAQVIERMNNTYNETFEWAQYEDKVIEPYRMNYDEDELYDTMVKRCYYLGDENCTQNSASVSHTNCGFCGYRGFPNCYKRETIYMTYMEARQRILSGEMQREEIEAMECDSNTVLTEALYRLLAVYGRG